MQERSAAIIVAAGVSSRMQGRDKLWTPLAARITLARTIDVFEASSLVETIVLITSTERYADAEALCKSESWQKIASIVIGGPRRQDSVRIGLTTLSRLAPLCRWVMIHDGARPLVTSSLLEAGWQAVQIHQAVTAAVPVKETMKLVQEGKITATLDRSQLWTVQTPQLFSFPLLLHAYMTPQAQEDVTDDVMLLQRLGHPVSIFPGSYSNIKITTPDDLLLAEELLQGYSI
jgi:2-C-methyl-D-erythritol 4-phosphate cytidylyltransferase